MMGKKFNTMSDKLNILNSDLGNAFKYAIISSFLMFAIPFFGIIIAFFMNLVIIYYLYQNNKKNNLDNYLHILGIFGLIGVIIYNVQIAKNSKNQINNIRFSTNRDNANDAINNDANTSSNDGGMNNNRIGSLDDDKIKNYDVVYEQTIESKKINNSNFQNSNSNNSAIAPQSGLQNFIIWTFVVLLIFGLVIVYAVTYFIDKYGINFS